MRDLYEILGVSRQADAAEIKKKYRQLAKKHHPDLNPDDEKAQETFKEINIAYEVLIDNEKRAQYDRYGDAIFQNGGAGTSGMHVDFSDLFGDIFDLFGGGFSSGGGRRSDPNRPRKGSDIQHEITLEFEDAIFGSEKEIKIPRIITCPDCGGSGASPGTEKKVCDQCHGTGEVTYQQNSPFGTFINRVPCDKCGGTGEIIEHKCERCHGQGRIRVHKTIKVKIPEGVNEGSVIKMNGEGNVGVNGGPAGDLYVFVHVKEHEFFKREGNHIFYRMPISFVQAALGAKIQVPTLKGLKDFEIPKGTQTGTRFTLKEEGVDDVHGRGKGDIVFEVQVVVPKKLSEKQEELLKSFAAESEESFEPIHKKSFFERIKEHFES